MITRKYFPVGLFKTTIFLVFFSAAITWGESAPEVLTPQQISEKVQEAIGRYINDPTSIDGFADNGYFSDGIALLRKYHTLASPKLVYVGGKPIKYLVPIAYENSKLAGFIHVEPFTAEILGWPLWDAKGKPVYLLTQREWEGATNASWTQNVLEWIPTNILDSGGQRVDPYSEKDWNIVDHGLDSLPFKNQEDRKAWIQEVNEKYQPTPRWTSFGVRWRQPALKCLSYAAATCADWWTLEYGRKLGSYVNIVNGFKEYGHNPRALESMFYVRSRLNPKRYFTVPFYPDPVTHEKIPFSLPGFAEALTHPMKGSLPDPVLPSAFVYELSPDNSQNQTSSGSHPGNVFSMEASWVKLFQFNRGKDSIIKKALNQHGVVYAHLSSGIPVIGFLTGIHGVAIVGYKDTASGTLFLYRESFGNFSSKYSEDFLGGPKYRAHFINSINQAYSFPHSLYGKLISINQSQAIVQISNGGDKPIDVDLPGASARLVVSDLNVPVRRGANAGELVLELPDKLPASEAVQLILPRKYYYQANGKPACSVVSLTHRPPRLDPYDLALKSIVSDALDRLEVFLTTLEVRKSSYAFYSFIARFKVSNQLRKVLNHRITLDNAWDRFAALPNQGSRQNLVSMMNSGFYEYAKDLIEYEKELCERFSKDHDAKRRELIRIELLEVRKFISNLMELKVRLKTIVSVMPPEKLDSTVKDQIVQAPNPEDPNLTGATFSSQEAQVQTDVFLSPIEGDKKLNPTAKTFSALEKYKTAYLHYQEQVLSGDEQKIQKALNEYREAYDNYRSSFKNQ